MKGEWILTRGGLACRRFAFPSQYSPNTLFEPLPAPEHPYLSCAYVKNQQQKLSISFDLILSLVWNKS